MGGATEQFNVRPNAKTIEQLELIQQHTGKKKVELFGDIVASYADSLQRDADMTPEDKEEKTFRGGLDQLFSLFRSKRIQQEILLARKEEELMELKNKIAEIEAEKDKAFKLVDSMQLEFDKKDNQLREKEKDLNQRGEAVAVARLAMDELQKKIQTTESLAEENKNLRQELDKQQKELFATKEKCANDLLNEKTKVLEILDQMVEKQRK